MLSKKEEEIIHRCRHKYINCRTNSGMEKQGLFFKKIQIVCGMNKKNQLYGFVNVCS